MQPMVFSEEWLALVRQLVSEELQRRHWSLADQPALFQPGETFLDRVIRRVQQWQAEEQRDGSSKVIREAAVHEYCHLLHASIQMDGSRVQQIALEEAMRHGWPIALKYSASRDQAESALLRAATQAWLHIDKCRPGSFLAWFAKIVLNETRQIGAKSNRILDREVSGVDMPASSDPEATSEVDAMDLIRDAGGEEALKAIERDVARRSLVDKLRECLKNARREFIIWAEFFMDLAASEIARRLSVTVSIVHVEKSRALSRIRKCCPEFIAELQLALGA